MPSAPVGPMVPWGPLAPTAPVAPAGPMGPVSPVGPVAPRAPGVPLAPVAPDGPAGPTLPCAPGGPVAPTAPGAPVEPGGPNGPVGPSEPEVPVEPVAPVGPVLPVSPAAPGGPVDPAIPVAPCVPVEPASPWAPVGPVAPGDPVAPCGPVGPVAPPPAPAGPVAPVGPGTPGIPVAPVGPASPVGPMGPTGPVGPTSPPAAPPETCHLIEVSVERHRSVTSTTRARRELRFTQTRMLLASPSITRVAQSMASRPGSHTGGPIAPVAVSRPNLPRQRKSFSAPVFRATHPRTRWAGASVCSSGHSIDCSSAVQGAAGTAMRNRPLFWSTHPSMGGRADSTSTCERATPGAASSATTTRASIPTVAPRRVAPAFTDWPPQPSSSCPTKNYFCPAKLRDKRAGRSESSTPRRRGDRTTGCPARRTARAARREEPEALHVREHLREEHPAGLDHRRRMEDDLLGLLHREPHRV